ncbi:MAG: hypothetical protein ACLU42_12210 [Roseburia faecis]|jgi:hypothetical protein|uniref:Uncharacterized protein n=1 Tax=Roseburia faecis TaxID=301302 RepID=A0A844KKR1_9FIRM|nr:hypothetical protein [Roseburia faecis]MTR80964.1 hypothetical protein [Roseburia faecis]MTR90482.1 hypothetical protein [Roseburia faecis]
MDIEELKELRTKIENILVGLRQNRDRIMNQVNEVIPEISLFLNDVLNECVEQKDNNKNLPIDILIQQVKNWNESYIYKDIVMMADTIQYELMEAIEFYIQIKENSVV